MRDSDTTLAPPSSSLADGGGMRIVAREGRGARMSLFYRTLALALIGASVGVLLWRSGGIERAFARAEPPQAAPAAERVAAAAPTRVEAVSARPPQTPPGRDGEDPTPDLADFVPPGREPTMAEVIDHLHKAGIRTGLGAFNPPGTSPPLVGLAVPEDFPLPEGYVRHYQATDDGQRIEPILMFSPDFEFFDDAGRRIAIPENRVVPPSMAPPGLPIRPIEIPPPQQARGP